MAERMCGIETSGIMVLVPGDERWPKALADLGERAPYVLWARGAASFLARPLADFVTITDSRAATSYGEHVAGDLAAGFSGAGRVVVAGRAYGIEGAAHRAALAVGGDTIAVLAGGVDRPYPNGHHELLEGIAGVGLLVSELPPGSTPTRQRFLARGRLMAALSMASVVVEASARSGSLGVAAEAHRLGRGVGAVPGPVTSVTSAGPHALLRDGAARIVTSAVDVEDLMNHAPGCGAERTALGPEFARRQMPSRSGSIRSF
ncbi:MAG: DNA-processing protein DprA [Marmoricola sp.]